VGPAGHPPTLAVRDDRLLPRLDSWLAGLFVPRRVEDIARQVVQSDTGSHREDRATGGGRAILSDCQAKLDRYMKALEAGIEPDRVVARTAELQRERAAAEAALINVPPPPAPLDIDDVIRTLSSLHRVPSLLGKVDRGAGRALPDARPVPRIPPIRGTRRGEAQGQVGRGPGACRRSVATEVHAPSGPARSRCLRRGVPPVKTPFSLIQTQSVNGISGSPVIACRDSSFSARSAPRVLVR
jgi:hypothetical protein